MCDRKRARWKSSTKNSCCRAPTWQVRYFKLSSVSIQSVDLPINIWLVQRGAGRSSQERSIYIRNGVGPFRSAPSEQQVDLWESACSQRKARCKTVNPRIRPQVSTLQTNFPFIDHEGESEGTPDGMFKALTKKHHIGSAKTKILVAAEGWITIDVGTAQSRLKVEGHHVASRRHRSSKKKSQPYRSFAVPSNCHAFILLHVGGSGALVWSIRVIFPGHQNASSLPV